MPLRWLTALLGLAVMPIVAHAQAVDPKACAPDERATIGRGEDRPGGVGATGETPPTPQANKPGEPLSEKLARTGGVICPPAGVDPGIAAPPPGGGRTPVIPPPGTPGGNPDVTPK